MRIPYLIARFLTGALFVFSGIVKLNDPSGFGIKLNDTTNAFKAYRRSVITGIQPILSQHFNLTVELPLKAIVRGYSWTVIPITWRNRRFGVAKLKIAEMGSRYLFICLYVWLEKTLSRGDYKKPVSSTPLALPEAETASSAKTP